MKKLLIAMLFISNLSYSQSDSLGLKYGNQKSASVSELKETYKAHFAAGVSFGLIGNAMVSGVIISSLNNKNNINPDGTLQNNKTDYIVIGLAGGLFSALGIVHTIQGIVNCHKFSKQRKLNVGASNNGVNIRYSF